MFSDFSGTLSFTSLSFIILFFYHSFLAPASWLWYIFLSWLPTYLQEKLGFGLEDSGFIGIIPYVILPLTSIGTGAIIDFLSNKKILPLTGIFPISFLFYHPPPHASSFCLSISSKNLSIYPTNGVRVIFLIVLF
jgi:hypothetical protein